MGVNVVLALILAVGGGSGGEMPWYGHYDRALALIDDGRPVEAREHLEAALALRNEPGRLVRTYGLRYVDYLPHLYLTVAAHMAGDLDGARAHLAAAERWGVAAQTEVGSTLLPAYRLLLGAEAGGGASAGGETAGRGVGRVATAPPGGAEVPAYRQYEAQEPALPEDEVERMRAEIGSRCGLPPGEGGSLLPWYFHYELGLALARRGDPQRAVDELVAAAERRPVSQHGARMYGMWFTDYLPYYAIAQAHVELGNWECALDALRVSEEMGEVEEGDKEYAAFRALLEQARSRD